MKLISRMEFRLVASNGAILALLLFGSNMLFPSIRTVLAFTPRSMRVHRLQVSRSINKQFPRRVLNDHVVSRWMASDGDSSNAATEEKTEEEKAAIKAAREARK